MLIIGEALRRAIQRADAAGIEDARLECELLMAHALASDRTHVLAGLTEPISDARLAAFNELARRRIENREPLAYITGRCEFYGLSLICAAGALIPRPETEMLVDLALEQIAQRSGHARIVDVGTGTGAVACAIAALAPDTRVLAVDASTEALAIAAQNVASLGLGDRVALRRGDLLADTGEFDVIVANLPYVADADWADLALEIRLHEPKQALVPGPRGTEAIERLLRLAPAHLAACGVLAAEMGAMQGGELVALAVACFPQATVSVMKDFAGLDRVLVVRANGED